MRYFLWLLVLSLGSVYAQQDSSSRERVYRNAVTIAPLSIFSGLLKIDYERFPKMGRYSLGGGVMLGSIIKTNDADIEFTKQTFGVDFNPKLYLYNTQEPNNFYLNFALRYQYITLAYEGDVWTSTTEDGVNYYRLERMTITPLSHRFALAPQLGYVYRSGAFFMDIYAGATIYKDHIRNNLGTAELPWNSFNVINLDRMTLLTGIKLGLMF